MSEDEWQAMTSELPMLLDRLLASKVYGRRPGRERPPADHGIYLFTEHGRHLYVGRTGWTKRSRNAGLPGRSGFAARLRGHCAPSATHASASFAWWLAREEAERQGKAIPVKRADWRSHPDFPALFASQKERVAEMDFRTVTISDDRLAYLFEMYAAVVLDTPYDSFETS